MAARAGCYPASQGRKLEALGKVAQGEAVGSKLFLQGRAQNAGLDAGGAGNVVQFQHPVQPAQVDRYDAVATFGGFNAAHYGAATTVGDGGVAPSRAPIQEGDHVVFIDGIGNHVGWVREAEIKGADSVLEVAAVGVDGPLVGVGGADRHQRAGDVDAGRAQVQVVAGRYGWRVDGDTIPDGKGGGQVPALRLRGFVGLHTPGPETFSWHSQPRGSAPEPPEIGAIRGAYRMVGMIPRRQTRDKAEATAGS